MQYVIASRNANAEDGRDRAGIFDDVGILLLI